jgi:hypothetical protein
MVPSDQLRSSINGHTPGVSHLRSGPTPNMLPPASKPTGFHEEVARGVQDASVVAARGNQDWQESPAQAASAAPVDSIPGFPPDLLAVVRPASAQTGADTPHVDDSAPAAPIQAPLRIVAPTKSDSGHQSRPIRRGPSEITRRRRDGAIPDQPPLIPSPPNCPYLVQSLKYTLAFGPDPCRNRILALFEFWANGLPKEDGVVHVEASLTWICEGLFLEFSRHEVSKAMGLLHKGGLITRPSRGPHERRSPGRRDILTFHVDALNERIRDAVAGTDGYRFDDWTDLLRKRFPSEYHKAANHTGPFNQCTTCTGWRMNDVADPTINQGTTCTGSPINQGTAYTGSSGSDQGTTYTGGRARRTLVGGETSVPGALHKGSSVEKEEEANTTALPSLPSFAAKTENLRTVTEPPVQVEAPTPIPRCAAPLTPLTEEPENELLGSSVMPLHGDPRVRGLIETYPEQLTARHASLILERLKDPEFAARYTQILGDASEIVNERIAKPVLWALGKKDGIENWKKILDGKMVGFMKGARRVQVPDPALSLSQDAGVKPGKTPAQRFDSDRMHLETKARQYRLPERFPAIWAEWKRRLNRWCADKGNPNFDDRPSAPAPRVESQ